MPSPKKMKAIREQKARQSAFYKAKREANPDSKDYKKPGEKKKDAKAKAPPKKKDAKAKAKAEQSTKPKVEKKTKQTTKPSSASKPNMLARGSSAVTRGAGRGGWWGLLGAGLAWAGSEALRFDPKVAREQLAGSGGPKKLSAKQRAVQEMQRKKIKQPSSKPDIVGENVPYGHPGGAFLRPDQIPNYATKPTMKKPIADSPGPKKKLAPVKTKLAAKKETKKASARVGDPKEATKIHSAISKKKGLVKAKEAKRATVSENFVGVASPDELTSTVTAKENPMGRSIDNVLRGIFSFAGALPQASNKAPKSRQRKDQEKGFKQFLVK